MPSYKLIYFNGKGRAETARYMFAIADMKYEDYRIKDDWKDLKSTFTFGQVPVLEVDGKQIDQSNAINRYLATKLDFYGKTSWDRAMIDVVVETGRELTPHISEIFSEKDDKKKDDLKKKFEEEHIDKNITRLEKLLNRNKNGKGWFVGDKMTLADIQIFNLYHDFLPVVCGKKELDLSKYKIFKGFIERFAADSKAAKWIKNRAVTNM